VGDGPQRWGRAKLVRKEGERGKRKGKGKGRGGDSIHSCVDGAECVATKARWEGQERLTTGIGRTDNHCTISAEGGNSDHRREEDRSGTFVEKGGGVGPGEKDIKRSGTSGCSDQRQCIRALKSRNNGYAGAGDVTRRSRPVEESGTNSRRAGSGGWCGGGGAARVEPLYEASGQLKEGSGFRRGAYR
jgi:hypothetical protein